MDPVFDATDAGNFPVVTFVVLALTSRTYIDLGAS
jgi:hypothetical protein